MVSNQQHNMFCKKINKTKVVKKGVNFDKAFSAFFIIFIFLCLFLYLFIYLFI